ncbi:hypothetical protein ABEB36_014656 [Hypothenemus hampei]|uniref:Regulatory protein zeste n=1 Tax=Hypothenemus hampei TaxID=57062 RepID=A0ABD1E729_HYPHA
MNEKQDKRCRAPNYSQEEKMRLLSLIAEMKDVIENKTTDAVTWHQKEEAWKEVTIKFNASSLVKRSVASIKNFYENQKRNCHKKASEERRYLKGTGGGPALPSTSTDNLHDLTLAIVNKKTVYGLECEFGTCDNWGKCTPLQLRRPISQKLQMVHKPQQKRYESPEERNVLHSGRRRPALSATENVAKSYEQLSEAKKELTELQIIIHKKFEKNLNEIEEELKIQRKRNEELHQLEVNIKKAQLAGLQMKLMSKQ